MLKLTNGLTHPIGKPDGPLPNPESPQSGQALIEAILWTGLITLTLIVISQAFTKEYQHYQTDLIQARHLLG